QEPILCNNINKLGGGEIEIRTLSMVTCKPRKCRYFTRPYGPAIKILLLHTEVYVVGPLSTGFSLAAPINSLLQKFNSHLKVNRIVAMISCATVVEVKARIDCSTDLVTATVPPKPA
ncbi:MAG: hypothetical protein KDK75_23700, partial [Alphaproteobacteria bacterium]|nr:hypothetical protein [Alphaproteobacteria bacterium]